MDPEVIYAVKWIEVEFGQRDEGYQLFVSKDECIRRTKESSAKGYGSGSYLGPVRPESYVEVPFSCLEDELKDSLRQKGVTWTHNHWSPRFKGKDVYIK